jgi:prolyl-tRNA synthetase
VQLPLFIKTSDFLKEIEHVEGFAPECFTVDRIGTEKIEDPLIVRPTSEVLFSQLFKDQIMSYKDLPMKYNQWCSVYRAEKTTKPFLRGSEFF